MADVADACYFDIFIIIFWASARLLYAIADNSVLCLFMNENRASVVNSVIKKISFITVLPPLSPLVLWLIMLVSYRLVFAL